MKRVLTSLFITIFLYVLLTYMLDHLPVFNEQRIDYYREQYSLFTKDEFMKFFLDLKHAGLIIEILNEKSLSAMAFILFLLAAFAFGTIHMFVDKLFFKKFYEEPNGGIAIRRSFLFAVLVLAIITLRMLGLWSLDIVAFVVVMILMVEGFIIWHARANLIKEVDSKPNENEQIQPTDK